MYRAAIFVVWRNYVKARNENRRDDPPAVALGIGSLLYDWLTARSRRYDESEPFTAREGSTPSAEEEGDAAEPVERETPAPRL